MVGALLEEEQLDTAVRRRLEGLAPAGGRAGIPAGLLLPALDDLGLLLAAPRLQQRLDELEQIGRRRVGLRARPPDDGLPRLLRQDVLELRPRLLGGDDDQARPAQPAQALVDVLGDLLQVVVDELLDVPLVARLRPAALVVAARRLVVLVDDLLESAGAQAVEVAALAADEDDERSLPAPHQGDERLEVEAAADLDRVRDAGAQRQRHPEVVERRAEDRQSERAVAVELLLEVIPQALDVLAQPLLALVRQLRPPGRLRALDLVDQGVHASVGGGRGRRVAGVEIEIEADRAAVLRAKARQVAQAVPTHCRGHRESLRRKAAILCAGRLWRFTFAWVGTPVLMANPLQEILLGLNVLRDQVRQGAEAEWLDRLDPRRPAPDTRSLEELQAELDSLVGLESVKDQVRALVAFLQVQGRRLEHGLPEVATSQHLVFLGNPGTGKTTVARLLAEMYGAMGLLEKGHLRSEERAGLVGEYVGMTAIKTDRAIRRALDGVLFVDEAYALARSGWRGPDFGQEAIETLLKRMEDYRHRLVVIVAGYPRLMDEFLDSNPGLRSRFSREISFPDYSTDELVQITEGFGVQNEYRVSPDGADELRRIFGRAERGEGFGNARYARTMFEQALNAQALRLSGSGELGVEDLISLEPGDFTAAAAALGTREERQFARRRRWRR